MRKPCPSIFDLLEHEGLCMGGSTGINVAGAIRMAQRYGPGPYHRHHAWPITAIAIKSKLFNPEFLREKGLPVPPWLIEQRDTDQGSISK